MWLLYNYFGVYIFKINLYLGLSLNLPKPQFKPELTQTLFLLWQIEFQTLKIHCMQSQLPVLWLLKRCYCLCAKYDRCWWLVQSAAGPTSCMWNVAEASKDLFQIPEYTFTFCSRVLYASLDTSDRTSSTQTNSAKSPPHTHTYFHKH